MLMTLTRLGAAIVPASLPHRGHVGHGGHGSPKFISGDQSASQPQAQLK